MTGLREWITTVLIVVGAVHTAEVLGPRVARAVVRASKALDRFGCVLVGHRPRHGRCVDCRRVLDVSEVMRHAVSRLPATVTPLTIAMTQVGRAAVEAARSFEEHMETMRRQVSEAGTRLGNALLSGGFVYTIGSVVEGMSTELRRGLCPDCGHDHLEMAHERPCPWCERNGDHCDGGVQRVSFDDDAAMTCWKCNARPETTAVGLCAGCFESIRQPQIRGERSTLVLRDEPPTDSHVRIVPTGDVWVAPTGVDPAMPGYDETVWQQIGRGELS